MPGGRAPGTLGRRALVLGLVALAACGPRYVRRPPVRGRTERGTLADGRSAIHSLSADPGDTLVVELVEGGGRVSFTLRDPLGRVVYDSATAPGRLSRYAGTAVVGGTHAVYVTPLRDTPTRYAIALGTA